MPNDNTRLVIFIDELDRCKPDYAIQLLERIKHYIISEQITFVFSVNIEQLQHTIKRFYGDDFDACSYLDRFFDFHVALSVPKLSLARWGSKKSIIFSPWCHFLAEEMNFDLRKQGHFYELIQQTLHTQGDSILVMPIPETIELYFKNKVDKNIIEKDNVYEKLKFTFSFIKCFFVPLVLALRMNNISDYYSFIDGKNKKQLEILINYLMKFKEEETSQNALMVNICSILDLSSSFSKICINANINEIINKLYDFLFTRIYDDYTQTTDSFEPFIINDIILFNYHIKNEIFGLLSFTTTSHSFIV